MAVCRGLRRRLRQTNPCTTCLVVVFLAVVFYLISAIRGIYFRPSAEGYGDLVGTEIVDGRRLSALGGSDGEPAGQRRRRKNKTVRSFVVGDDDVQLCTMTSSWASSVFDRQDYFRPSADSGLSAADRKRQDRFSSCSAAAADRLPTLFYMDAGGALKYNNTAVAGGKYDLVPGSCTAWKIEWNFNTGYIQKTVPLQTKIDADFIHVRCRIRRNIVIGGNVVEERRAGRTTSRPQRRKRRTTSSLIGDIAERRARQMHRDQLRRQAPHFVGTVGLPDPPSNVVAEHKTPSHDTGESQKQATENKLRPGRGELSPGFATHRVEQRKLTEYVKPINSRKADVQSLSRSERGLDRSEERGDADAASTEDYEQWIAQIHPLDEVVDRQRTADGKRLDVLILALESVSSISFDRDLQRTHRFLVDQPHTVLFTGYNVIGDAAPANIIPMLTGALLSAIYYVAIIIIVYYAEAAENIKHTHTIHAYTTKQFKHVHK